MIEEWQNFGRNSKQERVGKRMIEYEQEGNKRNNVGIRTWREMAEFWKKTGIRTRG